MKNCLPKESIVELNILVYYAGQCNVITLLSSWFSSTLYFNEDFLFIMTMYIRDSYCRSMIVSFSFSLKSLNVYFRFDFTILCYLNEDLYLMLINLKKLLLVFQELEMISKFQIFDITLMWPLLASKFITSVGWLLSCWTAIIKAGFFFF